MKFPRMQKLIYFRHNGVSNKLTVSFGMEKDGTQEPKDIFIVRCYLDLKIKGKWAEKSFGLLKGLVMNHAPDLMDIFNWHLRHENGLPMFYAKNGLYYYNAFHRCKEEEKALNLGILMTHINYGVVEDDNSFNLLKRVSKEEFLSWLKQREPKLDSLMKLQLGQIYNSDNYN